jgi:release factor glutamine methyltransferase
VTVQQAYAMSVERLARAGVASPQAEAWELIEAATNDSRSELLIEAGPLDAGEQRRLGEWLARRESREPLQLIVGHAHFYGLELGVEPGVLIPRPETERLVELTLQALAGVPQARIIDVGTGTGAVALALKAELPDSVVLATDIDPHSLALTAANADNLGLSVESVRSDLLESALATDFASAANALVSNPPYLPAADRDLAQPEVRWDPDAALYAGADGLLIYRRLERQARDLLPERAVALFELDPRNVEIAAAEAASWTSVKVHEDLAGRKRFLELRR